MRCTGGAPKRLAAALLAGALIVAMLMSSVQAQSCADGGFLNVGIYAATSNTAQHVRDVARKLTCSGFGLFNRVRLYDISAFTPSVAGLAQHDVVFIFTGPGGACLHNSSLLGDNLATYLNGGGSAVLAGAAFTDSTCLGVQGTAAGTFRSMCFSIYCTGPGYVDRIVPLSNLGDAVRRMAAGLTLDRTAWPRHPILAGVTSFNGGTQSPHYHAERGNCECQSPGAFCAQVFPPTVVSWSDGEPFAGEVRDARILTLNMFPPSADAAPGSWLPTTRGARLMANALAYVAPFKPCDLTGTDARLTNPAHWYCPPVRFRSVLMALHGGRGMEAAVTGRRVLILGHGGHTTLDSVADVRRKLARTGLFGCIDALDTSRSTPTLAQLQRYGSVLVFGSAALDGTALGNVLADYVDLGFGVVLSDPSQDMAGLSGRLIADGYFPYTYTSTSIPPGDGRSFLVPIISTSPLLSNVAVFRSAVTGSFTSGIPVRRVLRRAGTTVVARLQQNNLEGGTAAWDAVIHWRPRAGSGRVVVLRTTAPSTDATLAANRQSCDFDDPQNFWDASTDGRWLWANALRFAYRTP